MNHYNRYFYTEVLARVIRLKKGLPDLCVEEVTDLINDVVPFRVSSFIVAMAFREAGYEEEEPYERYSDRLNEPDPQD